MSDAAIRLRTTKFDVTEYLDSDEAISAYISEALAIGDPSFIADAIGVVARARGMTQIAKLAGLSRESLYKALSEHGNPELSTLLKVVKALGLELNASPARAPEDDDEALTTSKDKSGFRALQSGSIRVMDSVSSAVVSKRKLERTNAMAGDEKTSKSVASKAAKLLSEPKTPKSVKSVAASALTQRPDNKAKAKSR